MAENGSGWGGEWLSLAAFGLRLAVKWLGMAAPWRDMDDNRFDTAERPAVKAELSN